MLKHMKDLKPKESLINLINYDDISKRKEDPMSLWFFILSGVSFFFGGVVLFLFGVLEILWMVGKFSFWLVNLPTPPNVHPSEIRV